ncbi:MAG: hypothetical protein B5M48_03795 [Candidatus Omnitrophica bacterium 4484_213]|nr:MAG: hypothetical protein B5M48_03795 [Candidatus Omnitrophica bacterium 4484_213]
MKTLNIGLIGFGTIGSGVVKVLEEKKNELQQKTNCEFRIRAIADKDISSPRCVRVSKDVLTKDVHKILDDPEIDVVIELIGGIHPAKEFVINALKNRKDVITANKALLAEEGEELFRIAAESEKEILFEASVCGGIPIIKTLRQNLFADKIESLSGIVNGTSNYVLSKMEENDWEFEEALAQAKREGIAEADASLDTQGLDSRHKIVILARLIFNANIKLEDIFYQGIENIKLEDLRYAREFGYTIKLLAIAKSFKEGTGGVYVYPALISEKHLLSKVRGAFNALSLKGDVVGELFFYGKGAGMLPTASAVVADLGEIVRSPGYQATRLPVKKAKLKIKKIDELEKSYYIRFLAVDQPGVLAAIAKILGEQGVSIGSVVQKERKEKEIVPIVMMTHYAKEKSVQKALAEIDKLPIVKEKLAIRIEE